MKKQQYKNRILSENTILDELRHEYGDEPEKIESFGIKPKKIEDEDREIREYEENYYTRLVMTKKDKKRRENMMRKDNNGLFNIQSDYKTLDKMTKTNLV